MEWGVVKQKSKPPRRTTGRKYVKGNEVEAKLT